MTFFSQITINNLTEIEAIDTVLKILMFVEQWRESKYVMGKTARGEIQGRSRPMKDH